jgi:hypothetical protein
MAKSKVKGGRFWFDRIRKQPAAPVRKRKKATILGEKKPAK